MEAVRFGRLGELVSFAPNPTGEKYVWEPPVWGEGSVQGEYLQIRKLMGKALCECMYT